MEPCPEPHWLDADEMRFWRAFIRTATLLNARLERELQADCDLSLAEYEVLAFLSAGPAPGVRMSTLAHQVTVSRTRLTHTVDRLEKRGLVTRAACHDDHRGTLAVLTEAGWSVLRAAAPGHVTAVRALLVDHFTGDRDTMNRATEALAAVLSALGDDLAPGIPSDGA